MERTPRLFNPRLAESAWAQVVHLNRAWPTDGGHDCWSRRWSAWRVDQSEARSHREYSGLKMADKIRRRTPLPLGSGVMVAGGFEPPTFGL